jgi:hypothetical protein
VRFGDPACAICTDPVGVTPAPVTATESVRVFPSNGADGEIVSAVTDEPFIVGSATAGEVTGATRDGASGVKVAVTLACAPTVKAEVSSDTELEPRTAGSTTPEAIRVAPSKT